MNRYFTEVIDAHVAIADWLGKGLGNCNRSWRGLAQILG